MGFKIRTKIGIVFFIFFVEIVLFMAVFLSVFREYAHHMHELREEIEEVSLLSSLQIALTQVIMPANDFLIHGAEADEPDNFKVLSAKVEKLINRIDDLEFDRPEEKKLFNYIKENYSQSKEIALQIFSIPNAVGNIEAGKLMEKMDRFADNAVVDIEEFHQAAHQEIKEAQEGCQRTVVQFNIVVIVGLLFNIVLIIVGLIFFRRTISSPIVSLKEAVLEVGRGNLERKVKIKSRDEIGELAASFNKMASDLKRSRQEIESYSKSLEQKVEERTEELRIANEELISTNEELKQANEEMEMTNEDLQATMAELQEAKAELEKKYADREEFHKLVMGREKRVIELKEEIERLKEEIAALKSQSKTDT